MVRGRSCTKWSYKRSGDGQGSVMQEVVIEAVRGWSLVGRSRSGQVMVREWSVYGPTVQSYKRSVLGPND